MSQPTDSGDFRGRSCDCSTRLSARLLLDTRRDAVDRGARFLVCPGVDLRERRRVRRSTLRPPPTRIEFDYAKSLRDPEPFAVREDESLTVIDVATIDWIEAVRDYVRLHAGAATDLVRATTAALEQRLDPARFMRIHRSTIVQLDRIPQLLADGHGEYVAILHGGERLRVGRSYRHAVLRRLGLHW